MQQLFDAAGVPFDVGNLEVSPAVILEETDAYRELLVIAAINDAVRAVMVAFAVDADLDHLAAFYGVSRRVITSATSNTPAVLESNEEFRRRVLLAPEAFSTAGAHGAYVFHALSADPRVLNVDVWSPAPGEVTVAVQSREGDGLAPTDLVAAVRGQLTRPDIKPLTDVVSVRSVTNHSYAVSLDAYILPGPDPLTVTSAIEAAITKEATARRTPARDMPRSALIAAAQLPVVDKVSLVTPGGDIARDYGEVPVLAGLDVRVQTYGG